MVREKWIIRKNPAFGWWEAWPPPGLYPLCVADTFDQLRTRLHRAGWR